MQRCSGVKGEGKEGTGDHVGGDGTKKKNVDLKYKSTLVNSVPLVHRLYPGVEPNHAVDLSNCDSPPFGPRRDPSWTVNSRQRSSGVD